jgi:hypothetical protein
MMAAIGLIWSEARRERQRRRCYLLCVLADVSQGDDGAEQGGLMCDHLPRVFEYATDYPPMIGGYREIYINGTEKLPSEEPRDALEDTPKDTPPPGSLCGPLLCVLLSGVALGWRCLDCFVIYR